MPKRFVSKITHKVEPRGRVSLPVIFRRAFRDEPESLVYLLPEWREQGVHLGFTENGFDRYIEAVKASAVPEGEKETLISEIAAEARPLEIDDVGRIVLPADLREQAGIGGEALFVGRNGFFEVRAPVPEPDAEARAARRRRAAQVPMWNLQ